MEVSVNEDGHTVYAITSLEDFLKVPEDRLGDCLKDFKLGCDALRPIAELVEVAGELAGIDTDAALMATRQFNWIDDGLHGDNADMSKCKINLQIGTTGVDTATP